ncbi:hypothetical protein DHX103_11945 [Planococcus sp. X10-3]|uniref:hypothetical protein n=1 Tax=Planococcus sp. X10-3 TaxID=3061240 RepID=UPI003BB167E8
MKKVLILVFLTSLFLIPGKSFALSCVEPPPPDVAYDEYDAVLIGKVGNIDSNSTRKKLTIEVEKSFKGVNETTITVTEDVTWGESQENATYLFFLDKEGEKWIHPLCSPTTHNTDLADEYFADKEELTLQDVEAVDGASDNTVIMVLVAIPVVAIIAGVLITLIKRKSRI